MKTDYFSCEKCGCVVDVEMLKEIEEKKSSEQQEADDCICAFRYRGFCDFEKIRCPCCKELNQREIS